MRDEASDIIPCYCWDVDPETYARCTREPGHTGDHYDPYHRPSLDDLALLPNLREVTFAEDGVLAVPDAAEVFAASGIDTD
ncbi:hypothetical protein [Streptomyces sp. NPDC056255]|uniref:hypothetical protein n=1 Tax=Streptomyces sp. NPDC056255 TaxID=3345764 RepID=UPI0035DEAB9D